MKMRNKKNGLMVCGAVVWLAFHAPVALAECSREETIGTTNIDGVRHWLLKNGFSSVSSTKKAKEWCDSPPAGYVKLQSGAARRGDIVVWDSPPSPGVNGHIGVAIDSINYQATNDYCKDSCTSPNKECVDLGGRKYVQRRMSSFGPRKCLLRIKR
ncbi:MAG: CHAP domain-containing protein [Magnetococcus sp. YQC-3]